MNSAICVLPKLPHNSNSEWCFVGRVKLHRISFDFRTAQLMFILVPIHSYPMISEIMLFSSFAHRGTRCVFMHAIQYGPEDELDKKQFIRTTDWADAIVQPSFYL